MRPEKPLKKKAYGFIIQPNDKGEKSLLVYQNLSGAPYRVVGGNVDPGETEEEALFREVREESGLIDLRLIKKLGTHYYFKEFIDSNVERHDYLLIPESELPETWHFT